MKRALHYVFKTGNRKASYDFYTKMLGMQVLRHEEFEKGCEATCNGPYDGRWSKTMLGYGSENDNFVIELTYNYGIGSYRLGNDYAGIYVQSAEAIDRLNGAGAKMDVANRADYSLSVQDPDGHSFFLRNLPQPTDRDAVFGVEIRVTNLANSVKYWNGLLGMNILSQDEKHCSLSFDESQPELKLTETERIDRGTGFGRIAFACPAQELPELEAKIKQSGHTILTPLVTLPTPGKADVQVVILADPDDHEICFVGDEAFRQLSAIDPNADSLIRQAIETDKSDDWFTRKGGKPTG